MLYQPSLRPALFAGRKAKGDIEDRTNVVLGDVCEAHWVKSVYKLE